MPGLANDLNISEPGYVSHNGAGVFHGRTFQAGTGITLTNADGIAGNTTIASTASLTDLHVARYIVSAGGSADGANYTTIATAYAAAVAAGGVQTVFVQPGSYTTNLTLSPNVNLCAFICDAFTPTVTIVGTLTMTTAGTVSISGIRLQTNSAALLAVTGTAASIVNLTNCYLNCTNNTGITYSSSDAGSGVNIYNCNGDLGTTGIGIFAHSGSGTMRINQCDFTNSGGSSAASTHSAGAINASFSIFRNPITTSGTTAILTMNTCYINTVAQNATCITHGSTSGVASEFNNGKMLSGSASCVSVSASSLFSLYANILNSTNTNCLTGSGNIGVRDLSFVGSSSLINTTTQSIGTQITGAVQVVLPAGDYTVLNSDYFIGATSSAARAITLPASPATGQVHVIKDITPGAATHNITISGNGNNILGQTSASTYVINSDGGSVTLIYDGVVWCVT